MSPARGQHLRFWLGLLIDPHIDDAETAGNGKSHGLAACFAWTFSISRGKESLMLGPGV